MRMRERGFTLIELMVAITLSMIGVIALTSLYSSTRQTYRVQAMQTRLTEDGRFALAMVERIVSQAGFRTNPLLALDADRITVVGNAITVKFESDGTNHMDCSGAVATAGSKTIVIQKTSAKLQCDTVDWLAPSTSGAGNATELVDFLVKIGVDTTPSTPANFGCGVDAGGTKPRDCIPDKFVTALSTGETAEQIVALQICMVLKTEATDASISKAAAVKDCSGTDISASTSDQKLYRTFRKTVMLRNR